MRKILCVMAAASALLATSAQAAEKTYNFSGSLTIAHQFSAPIPEWQFAAGQKFTGKLVYDSALVTNSFNIVGSPEWTLTAHNSPVVALSFDIALAGGSYHYDVPTQGLSNAAWHYAAVGDIGTGPNGWSGVSVRTQNYPIGWRANPPSAPVPPSAYVGSYNPHSVNLEILDFLYANPNAANLLTNTGADQDLVALFNQTSGFTNVLDVRFSDSSRWLTPGTEHLDAIVFGRLETFSLATGVPEPTTWAMLILGFGLVGGAARQQRKNAVKVAA